jgi:excisionase family DNA binding protein
MPAQMAMGFGLAQEMVKSMQQTPPPLPGGEAPPAHGATPGSALPIPELMSPEQAAQVLGVTEADVIASLDAGELKGKKIGSAWRITKTALDAFLAE